MPAISPHTAARQFARPGSSEADRDAARRFLAPARRKTAASSADRIPKAVIDAVKGCYSEGGYGHVVYSPDEGGAATYVTGDWYDDEKLWEPTLKKLREAGVTTVRAEAEVGCPPGWYTIKSDGTVKQRPVADPVKVAAAFAVAVFPKPFLKTSGAYDGALGAGGRFLGSMFGAGRAVAPEVAPAIKAMAPEIRTMAPQAARAAMPEMNAARAAIPRGFPAAPGTQAGTAAATAAAAAPEAAPALTAMQRTSQMRAGQYGNTWAPSAAQFQRHPIGTVAGAAAGGYAGYNSPELTGEENVGTGSRILRGIGGATLGGAGGSYAARGARYLPRIVRNPATSGLYGYGAGTVVDEVGDATGLYDTQGQGKYYGAAAGGAGGLMRAGRSVLPQWMSRTGQMTDQFAKGTFANSLGTPVTSQGVGKLQGLFGLGEAKDLGQAVLGGGKYEGASTAQRMLGIGAGGKARRAGQALGLTAAGAGVTNYVGNKIEERAGDGAQNRVLGTIPFEPEQRAQYDKVMAIRTKADSELKSGLISPEQHAKIVSDVTGAQKQLLGQVGGDIASKQAPQVIQNALRDPGTVKALDGALQEHTGMSLSQVKDMAGMAKGFLGGGGEKAIGAMGFLNNIADKLFGFVGLDGTKMTGMQKIVTLLGGLGLLGGALTGSGTTALLGAGGLAAGILPQLMGGNNFWGNPQQQQQPQNNQPAGEAADPLKSKQQAQATVHVTLDQRIKPNGPTAQFLQQHQLAPSDFMVVPSPDGGEDVVPTNPNAEKATQGWNRQTIGQLYDLVGGEGQQQQSAAGAVPQR